MSDDLRDLFKKELDQIPLRPAETWVPAAPRRTARPRISWRFPVALGAAAVVLIVAVVGGRQLASIREQTVAAPGVVAGKALYLSPSFNGSGWVQIDPVTLKDVTGKALLDIRPTTANNDNTIVSRDGTTILIGEFSPAGAKYSVYDGSTGQLRGFLTPEVPMVIDRLSADGRTAIGRLGSSANRPTDAKAIISVETGRVLRSVPAGPQLWTHGVIFAPDLTAIHYIVTGVPLSETSLDVSVQQPLSLIAQSTADGSLSAPLSLPGMTFGNLLSASPPKSVSVSAAVSEDGRQLAFLSYDGLTLDLVDTAYLTLTSRTVHRKAMFWDRFGPLIAQGKELIDQQFRNVQFTPDGKALLVMVVDIHYGGESPVRTARSLQRIEAASAEITAEVTPAGGIYSMTISPDGAALYLMVRTQEPPNPVYVLRRLDARTLDLTTERPLPDYVELEVLAAPMPKVAAAAPTPPTQTQSTTSSCTTARLQYLVEEFFLRYNAHHSADLVTLFNLQASAAGGGFAGYYDNPGVPVQITNAGKLLTYWELRFIAGDRFESHSASYPSEGSTPPTANPTVSFTRSFTGGTQQGNMKLVCNGGLITDVTMSSDYAGWGSREAFGVRFSVPTSWSGPDDIQTQKDAGAPRNWLVFNDASGKAQVTVWLWSAASPDEVATTRLAGGITRTVTVSDAGQSRGVLEAHRPASWSGPTGSGTYDNRHLLVQLTPVLVADVIVNAEWINGASELTAEQVQIQDRITVRLSAQ